MRWGFSLECLEDMDVISFQALVESMARLEALDRNSRFEVANLASAGRLKDMRRFSADNYRAAGYDARKGGGGVNREPSKEEAAKAYADLLGKRPPGARPPKRRR